MFFPNDQEMGQRAFAVFDINRDGQVYMAIEHVHRAGVHDLRLDTRPPMQLAAPVRAAR